MNTKYIGLIRTVCLVGGLTWLYKTGYKHGQADCANKISSGLKDVYIEFLEEKIKKQSVES